MMELSLINVGKVRLDDGVVAYQRSKVSLFMKWCARCGVMVRIVDVVGNRYGVIVRIGDVVG